MVMNVLAKCWLATDAHSTCQGLKSLSGWCLLCPSMTLAQSFWLFNSSGLVWAAKPLQISLLKLSNYSSYTSIDIYNLQTLQLKKKEKKERKYSRAPFPRVFMITKLQEKTGTPALWWRWHPQTKDALSWKLTFDLEEQLKKEDCKDIYKAIHKEFQLHHKCKETTVAKRTKTTHWRHLNYLSIITWQVISDSLHTLYKKSCTIYWFIFAHICQAEECKGISNFNSQRFCTLHLMDSGE